MPKTIENHGITFDLIWEDDIADRYAGGERVHQAYERLTGRPYTQEEWPSEDNGDSMTFGPKGGYLIVCACDGDYIYKEHLEEVALPLNRDLSSFTIEQLGNEIGRRCEAAVVLYTRGQNRGNVWGYHGEGNNSTQIGLLELYKSVLLQHSTILNAEED